MYKLNYYTKKYYEIRELSIHEYDSFVQDRNYIYFYLHIEELYSILKLNIGEFWKYLLELTEYHRLNFVYEFDEYLEPRVIVNQKLSNILTSFKSYEDLLRKHFSIYENLIENKDAVINNLFSKTYDEFLGYRFLYRLRNYMQHFNLPIQSVAIRSETVDIPLKMVAFTVEPEFDKLELLKFKKWSTVRPEIEKMKNNIACKPIVDNFHTAINTLHGGLRKIFFPKYDEVKIRIENILNETKLHLKNQKDESTDFAAYITELKEDTALNNIGSLMKFLKELIS
ncbi:MAG TPA: hypothetical protein PL018_07085 [Ignavibacteriaceae bacterium]|nr:hypothetical protein [Ignavibacteriaceae bacterium]HRP92971.1 hypothetical protein [Ignavibacteriaceae bacterium]HRQ54003.1 hypothetical protein [Ignavibacteriaceae bacterium]